MQRSCGRSKHSALEEQEEGNGVAGVVIRVKMGKVGRVPWTLESEQAWHVILGDPSLPWGDPMREVLQDREGQG